MYKRQAQKPGAPKGCGNYEFRIKDNGIGINKAFQKHIFEEFTREESSVSYTHLSSTSLMRESRCWLEVEIFFR